MIIVRTPTRISFFGGGTDYPSWYKTHGGQVLSSTINKYSYITARHLPPFFPYSHRIRYYQHEETQSLQEIKHPVVREASKYLNFTGRLEVVHNSDLPAKTGLGSSSTFTVGMLHALHALQGKMPSKLELASQAIHVEQNLIRENVGSQDQVSAAYGGLNIISFGPQEDFEVSPYVLSKERKLEFEESLLLCFTGFSRLASQVAEEQIRRTDQNTKLLEEMKKLTNSALSILSSQSPIVDLGPLLSEQWNLKKRLSSLISQPEIDQIYERGLNAGARGAKLLGAGGGGFMLFMAPPAEHEKIKFELGEKMFVPFKFETSGSSIIHFDHD